MASSPDRPSHEMSAEFIIEELDDALESMIYRWDLCLCENSKEASEKECCRQIQELVEKGKADLKLYQGGLCNGKEKGRNPDAEVHSPDA